ncbi:CdaR family protein [Desulfonatronovibrio hydrogenovorans]|uniref:CdaR family protein n=1 Tax=Desulfonatronovibrio hydrogenovorans TaxID=53245 RepID=UPI0004905E1E|nr:CdaR family protein [Desulfonatronovibrio hydrogenovorans]
MFKVNWQYRIIAAVLALFFWYLISGQEKVEIWLNVPVEIVNLPSDHMIRSGMVGSVRVRCRGTSTILNRLETGRISYTLDLSGIRRGSNVVVLDPKNINLPRAMEVVEISPSRLELDVDRILTKTVPVRISWQAHISPDFELKEIRVEPEHVRISGAARVVERIEEIESRHIEIRDETPRRVIRKVGLELFPEVDSSVGEVLVEFVFGPVLEEIWVRKPVQVIADEGVDYRIEPDHVRANLALPKTLLRTEGWRDGIGYFIRIDQEMEPGVHELQVGVDMPRDGQVVEKRPETIRVEIR